MAAAANCWDPSTDSNSARYDLAPCLRRLSLGDLMTKANVTSPRFVPTFAPFIEGFLPKSELRDLMRTRSEAFPDWDLLVSDVNLFELKSNANFILVEGGDRFLRIGQGSGTDSATGELDG